jgi:hypothetical protein
MKEENQHLVGIYDLEIHLQGTGTPTLQTLYLTHHCKHFYRRLS